MGMYATVGRIDWRTDDILIPHYAQTCFAR